MTKMSLELQVGFEPTPCRLQVGCSTTEATAACCRSFPAVRETSKVCVVLYWRKKEPMCLRCKQQIPIPPLRSPFGHYQYSTHFLKNRLIFFSRFSNAVQQDRKMTKCRAFSSVYLRFFQVQFFTEPLCCIFFVSDVKSVKHMPFAV